MALRYAVILLLLLVLIVPTVSGCASGPEFPEGISGTVFEDLNSNGIKDEGEPGVRNVIVSNGTLSRTTNKGGEYNLSSEGNLVFITTPRDYTPTGPWYRRIADGEFSFGLQHTPEKNASDFTFAQITDIHLDANHLSDFNEVTAELKGLSPAFVIATGDLIAEGNTATVTRAEQWFDIYKNAIADLGITVFNAVGNHDVVGIHRSDVASTEPGYGEGIYTSLFGPSYYSFDWGRYHCIVLDPNDLVDGKQVYQISETQLHWLQGDLRFRKDSPLLLFYHEPTTSWRNRDQFLEILGKHQVNAFCGHLHQDIATPPGVPVSAASQVKSIPEQLTGAVSGEWWYGDCPDGSPAGYRLVSISGKDVDSLYKGTGSDQVIDLDLRDAAYSSWPVVTGQLELTARIFSGHGSISEVSYQIDSSAAIVMEVKEGTPWATATAPWDTSSVADGYHQITLAASDESGSFSREIEVKVSADRRVTIAEVYSHFTTYEGSYVTLEGTVTLAAIGPSTFLGVADGFGGLEISDGTGDILVIGGECFSPPLSAYKHISSDSIRVMAVPLRLTWDFLTSTTEYAQSYSMVQQYLSLLPESMKEKNAKGDIVAIRGMRLLSAGDLTVLN